MVITRKRIKPYHPPLIMDNVVITEVDRHRHLGITFSSDLNWQNHITEIKTKAWQRLNILRAFKSKFDRRSLCPLLGLLSTRLFLNRCCCREYTPYVIVHAVFVVLFCRNRNVLEVWIFVLIACV